MDSVSEARLDSILPELAEKIRRMSVMLADSVPFRVTQGLRTWDEQDALYAQGRTTSGKIVTNAKGGYSYHCFGLAVDVVPFTQEPPRPDWNTAHPEWQKLIQCAMSLGLTSGSVWRSFPDWPHLQLTGPFPVSPDDRVRNLYKTEGMQAVWEAVRNDINMPGPDIDGEIAT